MIRRLLITATSVVAFTLSPTVFSQQPDHGTAAEPKAMLLKAVAAVKADKAKALEMFNKGEGGFKDRDLYVFCANVGDGKIVALGNPNAKQLIGQDQRALTDPTGRILGKISTRPGKNLKVKSQKSATCL